MKIFILTILIGLFLVVGLVYVEDPGYRWRDAPVPFSRNLKKGEIRISPLNFEERAVKISQMGFIERPDLLLLGSSRVRNVSGEFFNSHLEVFNGGMSTSVFEDYIAIWQALKEMKKVPSRVIILVDPWQFNANANEHLSGWKNIRAYVDDFFREKQVQHSEKTLDEKKERKSGVLLQSLEKIGHNLQNNFQLCSEVMGWPMFRQAAKLFWKYGIFNERSSSLIIPLEEMTSTDSGILRDGSFINPSGELKPKTAEALERIVREYSVSPNYFDEWSFDEDAGAKLALLVKDMASRGADVLVILPPNHPLLKTLLEKKPGYNFIFNNSRDAFKKALENIPRTSFCDAQEIKNAGCEAAEMMDALHMARPCVTKVLKYCTAGKEKWTSTLKD